ncbi:MAG: lipid-A-disaccharide synthase [Bacteroidetes bacterium]|nr:lipid-A-disaccharide synthase [Bacteroidota bacterium]
MRYYLIAGEASGDLHGSNLIKAICQADNSTVIRCWGGDLMGAASGKDVVKHYRELAFMGFWEVLKNLSAILKNISFCKKDILSFRPDVLVLIDYPGFNLRIAEWAKQQNIKVVYYISPQVWAWKENRVKKMKQCIDKMLVILPFEKEFYEKKWHWPVQYVGHPLMEAIQQFRSHHAQTISEHKPIIALLPGSRQQEIKLKLPIMLKVAAQFSDYQFVIAKAPGIEENFYDEFIAKTSNVSYVSNQTYALLQQATAALVTSGTATLETALFGVPQVVCYKGSRISYEIARRVIKVKYISLVNLVLDKTAIPELIQDELHPDRLSSELKSILPGGNKRANILQDYQQLSKILQSNTTASELAAQAIVKIASGN